MILMNNSILEGRNKIPRIINDIVGGSEIRRENHLGCTKQCKSWDELPTSTGERRISEPSTV